MQTSKDNIILIGYRGCGKTTVGRLLADQLGYDFVDTDEAIQSESGLTIAEIFSRHGEAHFRALESKQVAALSRTNQAVISVGGGAIENLDDRRLLAVSGRVVWLTASPEELHRRIENDASSESTRPALTGLDPLEEIRERMRYRDRYYAQIAHSTIDTASCTPEEVAQAIHDDID